MSKTATDKATTANNATGKSNSIKPNVMNANAKMGKHHVKHARDHRHHSNVAAIKAKSKVSAKHVLSTTKRG